jgi:tetratricopeptide (TPR) repeat protein
MADTTEMDGEHDAPPSAEPAPTVAPWWREGWVHGLALVALVGLVYTPVWFAGFVWDDHVVVVNNGAVTTPAGLRWIWTSSAADICPLTLTTFWAEWQLCGAWPLPFHLVTLALHAGCAVVLWRVLRALAIPGAWLGAAIWALHPVLVESVAWVSEMKNTQSGLFFLLAVLFFIRSIGGGRRDYLLSLLFAVLAIASKSSTVILPGVLLLCAWWQERRLSWRQVARVAALAPVIVAAVLVSAWTQKLQMASSENPILDGPQRLVLAGKAVWFYLGKLAWPHPIIAAYPRWPLEPGRAVSYLPLAAALALTALFWMRRGAWARPWFFAWSFFLVALLPVLGLFQLVYFSRSFVADHFQYLASMGPLALAGAGIIRLGRCAPKARWLSPAVGTVLIMFLGAMSWRLAWSYENESVFWKETLAKNPAFWQGDIDFGGLLFTQGKIAQAADVFRTALRINPDSPEGHYNLANMLLAQGKREAAQAEFRAAIKLRPGFAEAHGNLGTILAMNGDLDGAAGEYRRAVTLQPDNAGTRYNLAVILMGNGHLDEAIANLREAQRLDPGNIDIQVCLGRALWAQKTAAPAPAKN